MRNYFLGVVVLVIYSFLFKGIAHASERNYINPENFLGDNTAEVIRAINVGSYYNGLGGNDKMEVLIDAGAVLLLHRAPTTVRGGADDDQFIIVIPETSVNILRNTKPWEVGQLQQKIASNSQEIILSDINPEFVIDGNVKKPQEIIILEGYTSYFKGDVRNVPIVAKDNGTEIKVPGYNIYIPHAPYGVITHEHITLTDRRNSP